MLQIVKARYRRWRIGRHLIAPGLWTGALQRLPYARRLSTPQRAKLRELATLFLLNKRFASAHELAISETMRVCVAVKACVPVLELGLSYYSQFKGIVLYPGDFRVHEEHIDDTGVVHEAIGELCGQSLARGPMVLSWGTIAAERAADGQDLVIHECAHKLDALNGAADGFPPLPADMSPRLWTRVFRSAYGRLCADVDAGQSTRLDPYATEDPAEFFAVASETFFTRPDIVYRDFPEVYAQLAGFYRQNPYALFARSKR